MTRAEREAFVAAVLELKRRGTYDIFVQVHVDQFGGVAHFKPSFLPWHRALLYHFETELINVDRNVTLPYWDWTVDREYGKVPFTADFLGGPGLPGTGDPEQYEGGELKTGRFAHDNGWELTVNSGDPTPYLKRKDTLIGLPTMRDVGRALEVTPYDVAPDWLGGFRYVLDKPASDQFPSEGLHSGPHNVVGGHMAGMDSPNDPAFWLHHCMLDRVWSQWQDRHADQSQYLPENPTSGVLSRLEPMQPWCSGDGQVTPDDMLDHARLVKYE